MQRVFLMEGQILSTCSIECRVIFEKVNSDVGPDEKEKIKHVVGSIEEGSKTNHKSGRVTKK